MHNFRKSNKITLDSMNETQNQVNDDMLPFPQNSLLHRNISATENQIDVDMTPVLELFPIPDTNINETQDQIKMSAVSQVFASEAFTG